MSIYRINISARQFDHRYVVDLDPAEQARLIERLATLRQAKTIFDYHIEPQWVDPGDAVRMETFLSMLETETRS